MTRDAMIWMEAAEVIARYPSAVDAIAECLERAKSAAPVAAEPPSLVALVQEWRASLQAYEDGRIDLREVDEWHNKATAALLAWTPAQAEPAAPPSLRAAFEAGFQWGINGTDKYGDYSGGPVEQGFAEFIVTDPAALPASSPAAPAEPAAPCDDGIVVLVREWQDVLRGYQDGSQELQELDGRLAMVQEQLLAYPLPASTPAAPEGSGS